MGLLLGCAWNGVSMVSMCWAAATISKQCSVLCFVMAVFISQQAWLEKRTRAMQQLHLQNDLTYQVCSQQFKHRKKSVVCYIRSAFGGAFLEDSTRLMWHQRPACWVCHISAVWANLSGCRCWMHWQRSCLVKIDVSSPACKTKGIDIDQFVSTSPVRENPRNHSSALHITAGFRHVKGYVASLGIP